MRTYDNGDNFQEAEPVFDLQVIHPTLAKTWKLIRVAS